MSDIGLPLDGLLALLVAGLLGSLLLLAFVVCAAVAWFQVRRSKDPVCRRLLFPHMVGTFFASAGFGALVTIIIARDGQGLPRDLERWLDHWILLWLPGILLFWPLVVFAIKPKRRQTQH